MKIKELLDVTFNETPPPSKTSPLMDDDLDEEEAIKVIKKKNLENDNENDIVSRNKARLVAQGYHQQEGIDYHETYVGNKMHKAFPPPVIEFPLAEEVPTDSEESSHNQKKRDATTKRIALLVIEFRDSYEVPASAETTKTTSGGTAKHSRGNKDVNTASASTASTNVPTASANNRIDEDDMEEVYIKWSMALLCIRADKFWKKTRKKISIQGSDVAGFDKLKVECFNCLKMGHFARECRTPRSQDRGRRDNYRQGSKVEEHAPKALMAIDRVGWDWSYMANDEEDHPLVADEKAPTELALNANTSPGSKELETLKKEKDGVDGKLAGFLIASKDLDNLIKSQRSYKNKEGLGYNVFPPPPAQIYSSPKKDLSWTGLLEFADDTVIDYSRPSPNMESTSGDDQNRNPSVSETDASPSTITPKPFIKFVKPNDSPSKSKTCKTETPKKPPVKYAEQYIKPNKKPNVRGNQRNWNNLKSHQLGPNFIMEKRHALTMVTLIILLITIEKGPFQRTPAVRYQFRAPWVPTANKNFPPVSRKFSTISRNFPIVNRKFPTANGKFSTGATKFSTGDMGKKGKVVKPSACWFWKPSQNLSNKGPNNNSVSVLFKKYTYIDIHDRLNGCSRHMTCNISYLSDYEPFDGGYVSFGQGGCKITGKGTIKTGKLEFENVYCVKDLKYNIFSVSQICDNKNSFLFTDSKCIVLGRDFKLLDDATILLRTSRQHNMYSIDLNNIVPHKDLTYLVSKASSDECMLWHRRLGHLNFKTMNKLVRHNLVRGLPTKCFENDHTCTACLKGKQHKASYNLGKFEAKGDEGCFIGYSMSSKAFRVFNNKTRRVEENLHVEFLENKAIEKGAGPNWLFDIDSLTKSMNYELLDAGTNSTNLSGTKDVTNQEFEDILGVTTNSNESNGVEADRVWTLVDCPKGVRPIGTKWVLKNKKDERGIVIRNKARLVVQGHTQEEGINYNEVFAPIARIEAIRLFLAYALFMGFTVYQMDVKSAFHYGTIDEEVGTIDQTLFIKRQRGYFILVQVYVDYIIFGSSNLQICREFKALMHEKIQMSAMGELNFFLGLQVLHKENGIFLSQDKYVGDILKKFRYSDVRSSNTPMDKENPWGKDKTGKDVDLHLYRFIIGSLMYLTASRPDIMFAVCACARHQVTPKECHLHTVKRIFRYLKGHPKLGLWYPKEPPFDLVAYQIVTMEVLLKIVNLLLKGVSFWVEVAILEKSEHNVDFHPIVDFVEASPLSNMARLAFCDYHNLIAILEKYEHKQDLQQIVDFVKASHLRYALSYNPTVYVSHIRQFWSTARIETTKEGTKILATVDGKLRTMSESSIRRNLKLNDEAGISSLPDTELFENLQLMGYNILPNQKFTFQKRQFSHQ
nr:hypothetical protein [Tanacetum cinerariifolium]